MDSKSGTRLLDLIDEEGRLLEETSGVEVLMSGKSAKSVFTAKRIKKDLVITVSLAMILIILIIGYCFRTKDTVVYLLMPLVWGIVLAIAAVYLIQGQMSFIALGIGCIVLGVALSYCIHLITHHKYVGDPEQVLRDQAKPVLLEPIMSLEVVTPEDYMGDIVGDLNRRRGMLENIVAKVGVQAIHAKVPLERMFGYVTSLRTITSGRANSTMEFSHYAIVSKELQDTILKSKYNYL